MISQVMLERESTKIKGILIHRDPGALGDGVRVQGPEVDVDLQAQKIYI